MRDEDKTREQLLDELRELRGAAPDVDETLRQTQELLTRLLEHVPANIYVNFKHAGLEQRLAPELETGAYRVVQEALTNVARHAHSGEAAVRLWVDAGTLEIQVEDDGVGFDPQAALAVGRSSGLSGMQERVQLLGGRLSLEAAPGSGTHLLAELPATYIPCPDPDPSDPPRGDRDEYLHCSGG